MQYIISSSVPQCPKCAGILNKIVNDFSVLYKCNDCNTVYQIVDSGQAENELLCEEKIYERTGRI